MANNFLNRFNKIKNFFITGDVSLESQKSNVNQRMAAGGSTNQVRNVSNTLVPIQLPRIKQDVNNWRDALTEAENAWYPYRVILQQMYIDTINDAHTRSCIEKRKNLTLLRKFGLVDENDEMNEEWTEWLDTKWFRDLLNHILDARMFGYSLISLGDITNNNFDNISLIRRWNVSPDRQNVATVTYNPNGINFLEGEVSKWHLWVKTPSDIGVSNTGYGLLYPVSYLAIMIRNNIADNATYNELFGMPIKVVKSSVSNETERAEMYRDIANMGGNGGIILKPDDIFELVEAKSGSGYKSYADFEQRCEKKISKLILGHSDALEPTVGKGLGGQSAQKNGNSVTPAQVALDEVQTQDANFCIPYVDEFLEKARVLGVNIPKNLHFRFYNDNEDVEITKRNNELALSLSEIVANMAKGGIEFDPAYIEKVTGFKVKSDPSLEQTSQTLENKVTIKNAKPWSDEENYKGSGHSKEEYEKQKTDREYLKATKDSPGLPTMDKDEYLDYVADIQEKIDASEAIDVPLDEDKNADVSLHIGCQCEVIDGEWVIDGDNTCDDCLEMQSLYNDEHEMTNKLEIFKKHKSK